MWRLMIQYFAASVDLFRWDTGEIRKSFSVARQQICNRELIIPENQGER